MTPPPAPRRRLLVVALARIAALLAVLSAALLLAGELGSGLDPVDRGTLVWRIGAGAAISALSIGGIAILLRADGRRPLRDAGLTSLRRGWRLAAAGFLLWLVPAAAAFGALALLGMPLTVTAAPGPVLSTLALLLLAVLLGEALPEEAVFRGYISAALRGPLRGWWVILAQAAIFTAVAGALRGGGHLLDLSLFAAMGIGLGYLRMITGSIWMPVGFHTAFQTGAQLLLTHDGVVFGGDPSAAMLALGAVPFTAATILVSITAGRWAPGAGRAAGEARPSR